MRRAIVLAALLSGCAFDASILRRVRERAHGRAALYSCLSEYGCDAERYCAERSKDACPDSEPACGIAAAWDDPAYPCLTR